MRGLLSLTFVPERCQIADTQGLAEFLNFMRRGFFMTGFDQDDLARVKSRFRCKLLVVESGQFSGRGDPVGDSRFSYVSGPP
jgi:hypothetical protein